MTTPHTHVTRTDLARTDVSSTHVAERSFRAMGTDCHVLVYGIDGSVEALADLACRRVALLESLWSRFRDDSELSRLNHRAGRGFVEVSAETEALVRAMRLAWESTAAAFDPSVLTAITAVGYDRDFAQIIADDSFQAVAEPAPGMDGVEIADRMVAVPAGVGLDPGAIGKGLAADIVVDEMMHAGAMGVLVDLGGDIALAGFPGADGTWSIAIRDERHRLEQTSTQHDRAIVIPAGVAHAGIATSTSLTRRWAQARHHVIDPSTGASTDEALVQVTVTGSRAWECEVWATAALVRPTLVDSLDESFSCLALSQTRTLRDDFFVPIGGMVDQQIRNEIEMTTDQAEVA